MIEVKYPNIDNYDGQFHLIEIAKAYEVQNGNQKDILLYGEEKGRIFPLVLRYLEDIQKYVYIPYSKMELLNITSPILERKEVTEELIEKLNGQRIMNILEIHVNEKVLIDEKTNNYVNTYEPIIRNVEESTDISRKMTSKETNDANIQDIMELFSIHKKKALELLGDFVLENTNKYQSNNLEINILKLVNNLLNCIKEIPDILYTEDDLIDLGSLLTKLKAHRVNILQQNVVYDLIAKGYELCDTLNSRIIRNGK